MLTEEDVHGGGREELDVRMMQSRLIEMYERERARGNEGTISIETWQREMNNFQPGNRSQRIRTRFFFLFYKKIVIFVRCEICFSSVSKSPGKLEVKFD